MLLMLHATALQNAAAVDAGWCAAAVDAGWCAAAAAVGTAAMAPTHPSPVGTTVAARCAHALALNACIGCCI